MTSPYSLPDYRSRFFQYKTLTKILGEPTIDAIAKLHKEIKSNAQKVPTTLGGRQHVYLFLAVPANMYTKIQGTRSFLRPEDPGLFVPKPCRVARATIREQAAVHEQQLHSRK